MNFLITFNPKRMSVSKVSKVWGNDSFRQFCEKGLVAINDELNIPLRIAVAVHCKGVIVFLRRSVKSLFKR